MQEKKKILKKKRKKERNVFNTTRDKSEDCIMERRMEREEEGEGHGLINYIDTLSEFIEWRHCTVSCSDF
jgi:hypothetical protein